MDTYYLYLFLLQTDACILVPHPSLLFFFSAIESGVNKDVASLLVQQEVARELYDTVGCSLKLLSPTPHTP